MPGVTNRTRLRLARHLTDSVKIEKQSGRDSAKPGAPTWDVVGTFNGRLIDRSTANFGPAANVQAFDATIIVQALQAFADRNGRYRATVEELYGNIELSLLNLPNPSVKRTRVLDVVSIDVHEDDGGNDILQTLRCVNGRV